MYIVFHKSHLSIDKSPSAYYKSPFTTNPVARDNIQRPKGTV